MPSPSPAPSDDIRITPASTDHVMPPHVRNGYQKYSQFEPFAEGGSASLETCIDTNLGRKVLLKRLLPHLAANEVEQRRFLREARVTAQIAHPNTVPVYELSRDASGNPYFTMKRLHGRTLRDILKRLATGDAASRAGFPLSRLVEILLQVCHAVAYAHNHGVIHRDLKPANILVGEFGEVVVLDWGLAKVRGRADDPRPASPDPPPGDLDITEAGTRYGTPLYMSPEQAEGRRDVDERTDVYNLGVLLYEMLTLRPAVWGDDVQQVVHNILHEPPESPRRAAPGREIPRELEAVCLKALAKHPADRPASVLEFIADLRAWQEGRAVSALRDSPARSLFKFMHRHAALSLAAGFLLLGAAAASLAHFVARRPAGRAVLSVSAPGYSVSILPAGPAAAGPMDLGVSPLRDVAIDPGVYRLTLARNGRKQSVEIRAERGRDIVVAAEP